MKLTWHLVQKDLRRLWPALLVFALVLAGQFILGGLLARGIGGLDDRISDFQFYANIAGLLAAILALILVAAIVHEDPLVGSRAFWMTRPISGLRLLGAKTVVLLAAVVALPLLVALPWWLDRHFTAGEIARAASELGVRQLMLVLVALPFALFTETLAGFLLSALAAALSVATIAAAFGALAGSPFPSAHGVEETRGRLIVITLVLGIVATVVHHYRTRRLTRSLVVVGGTAVLALALAAGWRWDWSPLWERPHVESAAARQIQFAIESAHTAPRSAPNNNGVVTIAARAEKVPAGYVLANGSADETWFFADGTTLQRSCRCSIEPPTARATAKTYASAPAPDESATVRFLFPTRLPPSLAQRATAKAPRVAFDFRFLLFRTRPFAELPLQPDSTFAAPNRSVCITRVRLTPQQTLAVETVDTMPRRLAYFSAASCPTIEVRDTVESRTSAMRSVQTREFDIAGVTIRRRSFEYQPPAEWNIIGPSADRSLLRLVVAAYASGETIRRRLEVPKLTVDAEPVVPRKTH